MGDIFWDQNDALHFTFGLEGRMWVEPICGERRLLLALTVTETIAGGMNENNPPEFVGLRLDCVSLVFRHVTNIKGRPLFELARCSQGPDPEQGQSVYWLDGAKHA